MTPDGSTTRTPRLADRSGIVMGAGQQAGETIGNGRATALALAAEGASVMCVDLDGESAAETAEMIRHRGGRARSAEADWTDTAACQAVARECVQRWGRIDFLQNNVGVGVGDAAPGEVSAEAMQRMFQVNVVGCLLSCQAVLPQMVAQQSGSIVNVSSIASVANTPQTAYKVSKAAQNALGQTLAMSYADHGVRVNTLLLGLLDTPVAVNALSRMTGVDATLLRSSRDAMVPLGHKQGSAWDTAHLSVFLHSAQACFITGAEIPVDGGQIAAVGGNLVSYGSLRASELP